MQLTFGFLLNFQDVPEVDAITTNLENLQSKPAQKIEEDSENEDETENETGGGTMDCIPTPYGCIDLNDPSLRPQLSGNLQLLELLV